MPDKATLRKTLLATRQAIPVQVWRERSDRLCTQLQTSPLFIKARTVLAYFSFRQEPDLSPLFASSQGLANKIWGFPRCVEQALSWHIWSSQDALPLQAGAYGIPEPHPDSPLLMPAQVDLILVPSVACDYRGYRLGYGGGFYDRLLGQPEWAAKPAIGIVFDFAYLPRLPNDDWDRPLQAICTESKLFFPSTPPDIDSSPL